MARRAQFPPPITRHKSGQARIRVAGEDIYLGVYGSEEAQAAYARVVTQLQHAGGASGQPATLLQALERATVGRVVASFLDHAQLEYDPRGREYEQFRQSVRPLVRLYGPTPAEQFDVDCLEAVRNAMTSGSWMTAEELAQARHRRRPAGLARNTANRRVNRLRLLWRWAEKQKLVPRGAYAGVAVLRPIPEHARRVRHTKPRRPTTRADLNAVVPFCPPQIAAMLELQWLSGMRSCEVRGMCRADIDRDGPAIDGVKSWLYRVQKDFDKNAWRGEDNHAPRVVALGLECQRIIMPWLRDHDGFLFRPAHRHRQKLDHYTCYTYAQAVRRACRRASIVLTRGQDLLVRERWARRIKIVPYGGRHAAKMRITKELGADAARAVLGQKSIQTTTHYGEIDVQHAAEAMAKLG